MQEYETARHSLPLLAAGQAHKELFHNEALLRIDFLLNPVVRDIASDPEQLEPEAGECWLIGASPVGAWAGRQNQIAGWTNGGWRYFNPPKHFQLMIESSQTYAVFTDSWRHCDPLQNPTGGDVVDVEARLVIDSIVALLQQSGFAK